MVALVFDLIVLAVIVYFFAKKVKADSSRREYEENERAARGIADEIIKSRDPRLVTVSELQHVKAHSTIPALTAFCVNVILAGNNAATKEAVRFLDEAERNLQYWSWYDRELTKEEIIRLWKATKYEIHDAHWAGILGAKMRRLGEVDWAQKIYQFGINNCGGVDSQRLAKEKKTVYRTLRGKSKGSGYKRESKDWKTIFDGCSDLNACYLGLAACACHIEEECETRAIKKVESEGGYDHVKSGVDYERFVAWAIRNAGFTCELTPATDQGVDLVVSVRDIRVAVQCKFYSEPVPNAAVQEVVAGKAMYGCSRACVVSNSTYTPAAKALARANHVGLLHHAGIVEYLRKI